MKHRIAAVIACLWLTGTAHAATSVTVSWEPGPSDPQDPSTVATGFKVFVGTQPGAYSRILDVGAVTQTRVDNLAATTRYYFAVTAYNAAGLSSDPSSEVDWLTDPAATCTRADGTNGLVVRLLAVQSPVSAPGPGWSAFQVLDYLNAPLSTVTAVLSDGSYAARIDSSTIGNVRVWSGLWLRPKTPGTYTVKIRVTNINGCAAESAAIPLVVQ